VRDCVTISIMLTNISIILERGGDYFLRNEAQYHEDDVGYKEPRQ
jgi:hypothetical protein